MVTFLPLPFAIWLSLVLIGLLSLTGACSSYVPASLSQHPWVTVFPLAQVAFELPSSWVQVGPWQTESQVILHSGVLCVPGCSSLLSHRSVEDHLTSNHWDSCRPCVPWKGRCIHGYGTAQLVGAGGALAGHDPSDLLLGYSLCTFMYLAAHRFQLTPVRMDEIKNSGDSRCW